MSLPESTHLQFAILDILGPKEKSGKQVRAKLAERGIRKGGPAFYQLMARLEDASFVKGRYEQIEVDGYLVKERRYQITGGGEAARRESLEFYSKRGVAKSALRAGLTNG